MDDAALSRQMTEYISGLERKTEINRRDNASRQGRNRKQGEWSDEGTQVRDEKNYEKQKKEWMKQTEKDIKNDDAARRTS